MAIYSYRYPTALVHLLLSLPLLAILVLISTDCQLSPAAPTPPPATATVTEQELPTVTPVQSSSEASATPDARGLCPTITSSPTRPSPYLSNVVLAFDTRVGTRDPIDPTNVFSPKSTLHAVAQVTNAPENSKFTATWYADDLGSPDCNIRLDSADLTTQGSGNIDFTLSPKTSWPAGRYHVEIAVNGTAVRSAAFRVDESIATPTNTPTPRPSITITPESNLCGTIPPGKGGLVFKSYYGQEVLVDLAGQLYRVPPGGQSLPIYLDPRTYTFIAKINQVAEGNFDIEIVVGQCRTFTFSP